MVLMSIYPSDGTAPDNIAVEHHKALSIVEELMISHTYFEIVKYDAKISKDNYRYINYRCRKYNIS